MLTISRKRTDLLNLQRTFLLHWNVLSQFYLSLFDWIQGQTGIRFGYVKLIHQNWKVSFKCYVQCGLLLNGAVRKLNLVLFCQLHLSYGHDLSAKMQLLFKQTSSLHFQFWVLREKYAPLSRYWMNVYYISHSTYKHKCSLFCNLVWERS